MLYYEKLAKGVEDRSDMQVVTCSVEEMHCSILYQVEALKN